ncbi:MAG: ATP synthase F1 subunit gamma [Rickettsiales bacterium]
MTTLRDLKGRIKTVKSSQKITKAMQMVAASKLRKAKDAIFASRPYTEKLLHLLKIVGSEVRSHTRFPMIFGRVDPKAVLIICVSSDRGLCGAFNANIAKSVKSLSSNLRSGGKSVKILSIGQKAFDFLKNHMNNVEKFETEANIPNVDDAIKITASIISEFRKKTLDECYLVYNEFISVVSQKTQQFKLLPFNVHEDDGKDESDKTEDDKFDEAIKGSYHICEPEAVDMIDDMVTDVIAASIYRAMLENAASEHGARMTAMDNATRNANEMVKTLNIEYNRKRQAAITTELTEIISGAEAINDG